MTNDAEAREVHATVTDSEDRGEREPVGGFQNEPVSADDERIARPGLADEDDDVIEADSVIIAEEPADSGEPDEAEDGTDPDPVPAEAAAAEPGPVSGAVGPKHAATEPAAARQGLPVNGDAPRDAQLAGDPERVHERWAAIQSTFVDDPQGSVTSAADLVTEVIATVVASARERESGLRGEWDRDGVDTEGLRNALRNYRALLDQLVAL